MRGQGGAEPQDGGALTDLLSPMVREACRMPRAGPQRGFLCSLLTCVSLAMQILILGAGGLAAPRREEIDHSTKCILKQYQFCSGVISHHLGKVGPVPDPGVNMWSVLVNKKKREQFWDGSRKDFPSLIRESGQEVSV